jgi:hypothetical protein
MTTTGGSSTIYDVFEVFSDTEISKNIPQQFIIGNLSVSSKWYKASRISNAIKSLQVGF